MGHFVVYKEDTSCNSVFPELADHLQPNSLVAFDRGYNRLAVLQDLMKQGIHWVTRGSQAYKVTSLKDRPLPADTTTRCDATVIRDEWVLLGTARNSGPLFVRQITVQLYKGQHMKYYTSHPDLDPVEVVDFYSDHWALENLFRSLVRYWNIETRLAQSWPRQLRWYWLIYLVLLLFALYALIRYDKSILKRFISLSKSWYHDLLRAYKDNGCQPVAWKT